jgi:outer membrane protein OmpU
MCVCVADDLRGVPLEESMKKQFLCTTAIVGASFVASAAMAAPEVRLGGFMDFQVGMTTQDRGGFGPSPGGVSATNPERGYGFITDNEIIVRASDKLDNGLAWSLKIELEANTDDAVDNGRTDGSTADEVTLTLQGTWGQMYFGNDDGPGDTMRVNGSRAVANAGAGGTGGDWRRWVNWTTASNRFYSSPSEDFARDTSDATKIAYITPRFAGFQAGVSFAPSRASEGRFRDPDTGSDEESFWELGLNYSEKFGDFAVQAGTTAGLADNENQALNDTRTWSLGAMVSYSGFRLAAGYGTDGDARRPKSASNTDLIGWDVGLGYTVGAWDFGLAYMRGEVGNENGNGDHTLDVVTLGVTYTLGNGLAVYTEGVWFNTESASNNTTSFDNDGLALISGIGVLF